MSPEPLEYKDHRQKLPDDAKNTKHHVLAYTKLLALAIAGLLSVGVIMLGLIRPRQFHVKDLGRRGLCDGSRSGPQPQAGSLKPDKLERWRRRNPEAGPH
ncbi:uncharacterized protein F4817DRAFT_318151 [Daldinia loculata]|uniref:uncharacterized protein n=1 Tax=Daldinia loculata TaxID=103429 RepID=UPI0020C3D3EF|nr:uncharacterized protein F4817DRAFT_318151 [Daldinia loculata]KAI1645040.1 hypothetical protein F4817DRAFT_318151 [Daldinia loculata]